MNRAKVSLMVCTIVAIILSSLLIVFAYGMYLLKVSPHATAFMMIVIVLVVAKLSTKSINKYVDKIMEGSKDVKG